MSWGQPHKAAQNNKHLKEKNHTIQDMKVEIELTKKTQTERNLEMKNAGTQTEATE